MHAILFDIHRNVWLRFRHPQEIIEVHDPARVQPSLDYCAQRIETGRLFAVGFLCYEAARALNPICITREHGPLPLMYFGLFETAQLIRSPVLDAPNRPPILPQWRPDISREEYRTAIETIHSHIACGNTYQVNYTYRMHAPWYDNARHYFAQMVAAQQSHHASYIESDDFCICSASPELFFSFSHGHVVTRPMKGTTARRPDYGRDMQTATWLKHSTKNRAENLMIVDMLRNDIGAIANPGDVTAPSLFDVEKYPSVWQMTSTVTGRTPRCCIDTLRALFPCASITGAPKRKTMEIIAETESSPRGIYTGAIGCIAPDNTGWFSVAIRTVTIHKRRHLAEFGVGGGIVWDSTAEKEYEECKSKARVLNWYRPQFELLETMRVHRGSVQRLPLHLFRLMSSAAYFGFSVSRTAIEEQLRDFCRTLDPAGDYRMRCTCSRSGSLHIDVERLCASCSAKYPLKCCLAREPVDTEDPFIYHKTTRRDFYNRIRNNLAPHIDDALLYNQNGELTETTIGNLVLCLDGLWVTPPLRCGLLAGTFRRDLLTQKKIGCRVLYKTDLARAQAVYRINSVRGWQQCCIVSLDYPPGN